MNRISWWLVDVVSRVLEPGERDVVRGDFAESGETASRALGGVFGLAVRRQAALWTDWRPWVILTGLILPLGMLLSVASRMTAGGSATYLWLYVNNWDWGLLRYAEFWYELRDSVAFVSMGYLILACWSWTAGFVLGSASRRTVPLNGVLFCFALLIGGLLGAPRYLAFWGQLMNRPVSPDEHNPVSALAFYRVVLPMIVEAVVVAVPALWGMREGAGAGRLRLLLRLASWTAAAAALAAMAIQQPGVGFMLAAYRHPEIWQSRPVRALQLVVYWPIAYMAAGTIWRGKSPLPHGGGSL